MKNMLMSMIIVSILLVTTGCPSLPKQLSGDHSTVSSKVTTIYGTGFLIRSNPSTNQDVSIFPDGTVTIKSH